MSNKSNDNRDNKSNSSHGGKTLSEESYKPARTGDLVKSQHVSNTLPSPGKPGGGSGGGSGGGNKGK